MRKGIEILDSHGYVKYNDVSFRKGALIGGKGGRGKSGIEALIGGKGGRGESGIEAVIVGEVGSREGLRRDKGGID